MEFPLIFTTINTNNNTEVFVDNKVCEIIIKSLNECEKLYKLKITNFVVMPTHIHIIYYFNDSSKLKNIKKIGLREKYNVITNDEIDNFINNFKKFTGHEILKKLKLNKSYLLERLALKKERKRKHYFSLWQDDKFNVIINNEKTLKEKQKYIYKNPINEGLVKNVSDYKYIG